MHQAADRVPARIEIVLGVRGVVPHGPFGTPEPGVAEGTRVLALDPSLEAFDVEFVAAGQVSDLVALLKGTKADRAHGDFERVGIVGIIVVVVVAGTTNVFFLLVVVLVLVIVAVIVVIVFLWSEIEGDNFGIVFLLGTRNDIGRQV